MSTTARTSPFSPAHAPRRVLVVRLGAIGDVIRTLPAVRLVRRTWPGAEISWAVEEGAAPLLEGHPDLDRIVLLRRRSIEGGLARLSPAAWAALRSFLADLRAQRPDLSLDFQGSLKSGLVARLSGAPVRVGFVRSLVRERSHLFANVRVDLPEPRIPRWERAATLARAAGAADGPLEIDLGLSEAERAGARDLASRLAGSHAPIFVAPFSSRRQAWKRYPMVHWRRIVEGIASPETPVVVVHGPGDEEREARDLVQEIDQAVPCGPLSIRALAALISTGRLMIAGDTGPMHMAWAVGVPVVALYGPTDPVLNAPLGDGHALVAPPRQASRTAEDRFEGVEPAVVLERARGLLQARSR